MTIEEQLKDDLSHTRPSPGPGFESRIVNGAVAAAEGTNRSSMALSFGGAFAVVVVVVAFIWLGRSQSLPVASLPAAAYVAEPVELATSTQEPDADAVGAPGQSARWLSVTHAEAMLDVAPTRERLREAGVSVPAGLDRFLDKREAEALAIANRANQARSRLAHELARPAVDTSLVRSLTSDMTDAHRELVQLRIATWQALRRSLGKRQLIAALSAGIDQAAVKRGKPSPGKTPRAGGPCDEVTCLVEPGLPCCKKRKKRSPNAITNPFGQQAKPQAPKRSKSRARRDGDIIDPF